MLVDSHCHLDFPQFADNTQQLIDSMHDAGVVAALCVCVTLEGLPQIIALLERFPELYGSVGVHPDNRDGSEPDVEMLAAHCAHPRVIAIGETGLDYHWHKGDMTWQQDRFRTHIRAARMCRKPLIIHTREAAEDTLRIMAEEAAGEVGGVMHCFTETPEVAARALEMGFFISFSGIVTFKNASQVHEAARLTPLDRLLIETDAPYLAPVPHRGRTNEPGFVRHVAAEIARLRGTTFDEIAQATTANFCRLFRVTLAG